MIWQKHETQLEPFEVMQLVFAHKLEAWAEMVCVVENQIEGMMYEN
jgi:hypothetical protein